MPRPSTAGWQERLPGSDGKWKRSRLPTARWSGSSGAVLPGAAAPSGRPAPRRDRLPAGVDDGSRSCLGAGAFRSPWSRRPCATSLEEAAGPGVERLVEQAGIQGGQAGARPRRASRTTPATSSPGMRLASAPSARSLLSGASEAVGAAPGLSRFRVDLCRLLLPSPRILVGARRGSPAGPAGLGSSRWALLLLTLVPFRLMSVWSRARLAVGAGGLLKRRLAGALRLQPEEVRHQGAGQSLGRVIESEAVETLALNGGFLAIAGIVEILLSAVALAAGSAGGAHVLLLLAWCAVTAAMARKLYLDRRRWTDRRLEMTHDLVERLVGHRTRLAQEPRAQWHTEEDRLLDLYVHDSQRFDRSKALLIAAIPPWLAPGEPRHSAARLRQRQRLHRSARPRSRRHAGSLPGLSPLRRGFFHLSGAILSWGYAGELFQAAARPEAEGAAGVAVSPGGDETKGRRSWKPSTSPTGTRTAAGRSSTAARCASPAGSGCCSKDLQEEGSRPWPRS